ncbi:hypothetical protein [Campylobacter sp.]|uniref:hypothetical protein n=1 Tax=Campylobacter sp. TaxID=205 RepID=UPI0036219295
MTFLEFKNLYEINTRRGVKICGDDEFRLLMARTAAKIHRAITVLEKIETDDRNISVDYYLSKKYFVAKFRPPLAQTDEIDYEDESLLAALGYGIAAARAGDDKDRFKFNKLYLAALCEYETSNFDDVSCDLESALGAKGYAKPYEIGSEVGTYFIWDEEFLNNLDFYMADRVKCKGLSCRKFIYKFMDFQNGKYQDRADLRDLDRVMRARIRP